MVGNRPRVAPGQRRGLHDSLPTMSELFDLEQRLTEMREGMQLMWATQQDALINAAQAAESGDSNRMRQATDSLTLANSLTRAMTEARKSWSGEWSSCGTSIEIARIAVAAAESAKNAAWARFASGLAVMVVTALVGITAALIARG